MKMRVTSLLIHSVAFFTAIILVPSPGVAAPAKGAEVQAIVTQEVRPLMTRYGIPGMAVGVSIDGRDYVFNYGVASKATGKPVERTTLFEIGSITKTFTASLASYAQVTGRLSLSDWVSTDVPSLRGTSFDHVRLVNLGTHTAGGLPLQFPDNVRSDEDAMRYYERWKPSHRAGTYRLYSNPSPMLLGVATAKRMNSDFAALMQRVILTPLGLSNTFFAVPRDRLSRYAQGYTREGKPKRMSPGPFASEAYGIRTTASDMLRFVDANLNLLRPDATLSRAINNTHAGYYRVGNMTQDLIWEQYRCPVALPISLQGNSDKIIFGENKVATIDPPSIPQSDVLINKTGSTNGFGAYVAFIPRQKMGIALLANKSYPISARVSAAYRILARLNEKAPNGSYCVGSATNAAAGRSFGNAMSSKR